MNGHSVSHPSDGVDIIEDHYAYPSPTQANKENNSSRALKDNILDNDIGEIGLTDEQIAQLQNLKIQQQSQSIAQVEGSGTQIPSERNVNANINININNNSDDNGIKSVFETNDIGEPDFTDAIENDSNHINNNSNNKNKNVIETPQIPPELLIEASETPQHPASHKIASKTKVTGSTTKGAITKGLKRTAQQPPRTMNTSLLWIWIQNNCLRPFVSSFQQQVIADSIQIGLSILPILPIWRYLPWKLFGKPIDPCQDRPASFFENQLINNNKPRKKKSLMKRLWSIEGFFIMSLLGTLLTVVLIDNNENSSQASNSNQHRSNSQRRSFPMNNNINDAQNAYAAAFYNTSAWQASTMPNVPQSPQR